MSASNKVFQAAAGNAGEVVPTDPDFANTVLLLNADGASDGGQNNTFRDVSGNGHSITRNGNVTQGSFSPFSVDDGKWGNYFSGGVQTNGASLALPTAYANAFGSFAGNTFTFEFWVYPEISECGFIASYEAQSANGRWILITDANDKLKFNWTTSTGTQTGVVSTPSVPLNEWSHIAVTVDATSSSNTTVKLFVNGVVTTHTGLDFSSQTVVFDRHRIGSDWSEYYDGLEGYMSNVRIVKGALLYTDTFTPPTAPLGVADSGTTLLLTCQSNRFIDNSTTSYSVTASTGTNKPKVVPFSPFPKTTAYTQSVVNQGSVKFDGSSDYLDAPTALTDNDFTVECWVYTENSSDQQYIFVQAPTGSTTSETFMVYLSSGDMYVQWGASPSFTIQSFSENQWVHVAVTYDQSTETVTLYLNGTSVGTFSASDRSIGDYDVSIGHRDGSDTFDGYISNLRVVNGTVLYTDDFTVPTEPLTDITNTSLLTCQANGFVDNSSNAHTITVNGDPERTTNVPFGERSVEFDGSGDYLSLPSDAGWGFGSSDFTLEAWLYLNATPSANCAIFETRPDSTEGNYIAMFMDSGNTRIGIYANGSVIAGNSAATQINLNEWTHIAYVRDGSTGTIYINGVSKATGTDNVSYVNSPLRLMRHAYGGLLNGVLSNARIVKGTAVYTDDFTPPQEPLTAVSGTSLLTCQNAVFQDNSGNAHAITVNGDPQASTNLPFGERSVYFDGGDNYLEIPEDSSTRVLSNDFTAELFFYPNGGGGTAGNGLNFLIGQGASGVYSPFNIYYNSSTKKFLIDLSSSGASWDIASQEASTGTYDYSQWYHVALVREGDDFNLYVNGVFDKLIATSSATLMTPTQPTRIGSRPSSNPADGYISNARLVVGTAVYTAAFTPPTEPLTAVSGTSLLTCQDAVFQDNSGNAHAITVNGDAEASTNIPFAPVTTYGVQQYLDDAFTVSPQGGSGYFDGVNDYLSTADDASFNLAGDDFTIETWFYCTGFPASQTYGNIYSYWSSTPYAGFRLMIKSDGAISFYNVSTHNTTNTGVYNFNEWAHLACVYNSGQISIYVNGQQVLSPTTMTVTDAASGTSPQIGTLNIYPTQGEFQGYLSNFRIVKGTAGYTSDFTPPTVPLEVLPNTSLLLNFTNASILDATGRNVLETVGNAQVDTTTVKYGTGAMEFDGTGDRLVTEYTPIQDLSGGDWTIEFWMNLGGSVPTTFRSVCGASNGGGSVPKWSLIVNCNTSYTYQANRIQFATYNGADRQLNVAFTWSANTWYHIAIACSSNTTTLYVDGVSQGSMAYNIGSGITNPIFVGADGEVYSEFTGYLDDFRITKGIARYTANFTPPTAALPVIGE